MTKTYKVGDRVAVYGGTETVGSGGAYNGYLRGFKGTVNSVYAEDALSVKLDKREGYASSEKIITAHPKQCRRLKKKEPKTIYIPKSPRQYPITFTSYEKFMRWAEAPSQFNTHIFKEQK